MNVPDQSNKILVVTGGSKGIGTSIAVNAAKRGIGVILTYNNHPEEGKAAAEEINNNGGKAVPLHLDSSAIETFDNFTKQVAEVLKDHWGRDSFDYLVNNAGIGYRSLIQDTTEEVFDKLVNVNFKGVFFISQKLVPLMADGGHIINISSALSRFASPGMSVYGALKAGLESLTRSFAKELAPRKIRVNSVAPGAIDTEFAGGKGGEAQRKAIAEAVALGRVGVADDIGFFVASLLSEDSRFVNAQRIEVGGGVMI